MSGLIKEIHLLRNAFVNLAHMQRNFLMGEYVEIKKLSVQDKGRDWLVVVNGIDHRNKPVVAFYRGTTMANALRHLLWQFAYGRIDWKADKYAKLDKRPLRR